MTTNDAALDCRLGDDAARAMAKALQANTVLETLDLGSAILLP